MMQILITYLYQKRFLLERKITNISLVTSMNLKLKHSVWFFQKRSGIQKVMTVKLNGCIFDWKWWLIKKI